MSGRLSNAEVQAYRRDGAVAAAGFRLPDDVLAMLRAAADQIIRQSADRGEADLVLVAHLPRREGIAGGLDGGEDVFRVATHPDLLDVVEQVLGPDVVLWGSSIFAKPAAVGRAVQWHQEAHYWPMRPLASTSVWIAIDDADPGNGCLRYIPGSHALGLLEQTDARHADGVLQMSVADGQVDEAAARDLVVPAGGIALLDTHVIHGSNANTSGRRRAALTIRYMPATSHFDRGNSGVRVASGETPDYGNRPLWLVRGDNRHPGNDFRTGHAGLADYDDLAEAGRARRAGTATRGTSR